jgi:7-cyano-7-deazaguanine reductase
VTGDRPTGAEGSPLGEKTEYPDRYDPTLLFSMPRAPQREALGIVGALPFTGCDFWTAYEITWLDPRGKPVLAMGRFGLPADSPRIVESKSLKLYLGSFAQEKLVDRDSVARMIDGDLARACGAAVAVELLPVADRSPEQIASPAELLDALDLDTDVYHPEPAFLRSSGSEVAETLHSALFRSLCPVTAQPDYADVTIRYRGPRIDRPGLLRYLVSYRRHAAFHESCAERMFVDVLRRCAPEALTVFARFLRRGGIDINPFRSNFEATPTRLARTIRQ